jgi:hypothetical protein
MSRKIINTEGPGFVASSARKFGAAAIVAAIVVLIIFRVLANATPSPG